MLFRDIWCKLKIVAAGFELKLDPFHPYFLESSLKSALASEWMSRKIWVEDSFKNVAKISHGQRASTGNNEKVLMEIVLIH